MVAEEQNVPVPPRIVYAKIPLKEFGKPTVVSLGEAVDWVEAHIVDHRIMVCCRAGMGRSVSVVIAYFCCVERMSYPDALKMVLARRPGGMPLPYLQEIIEALNLLRRDRSNSAIAQ